MKYLIDTNVISELHKIKCNENVKAWFEKASNDDLFISVISIGEIEYGIQKLANEKKKAELSLWLNEQLKQWFDGHIISIDSDIMMQWGKICAKHKKTLPIMDSLIVATAIDYHLTLVTRNTKDFETIKEVSLLNPWNS